MSTRISELQVSYSSRGTPTYHLEMWHDGFKKHRLIRGSDSAVIVRKGKLQIEQWQQQWLQVQIREQARQTREGQKQRREAGKELALERTEEAQASLQRLEAILQQTLKIDDAIEWEKLKDRVSFSEPQPPPSRLPNRPNPQDLPTEPSRSDPMYQPTLVVEHSDFEV
jgi:restriction system protein